MYYEKEFVQKAMKSYKSKNQQVDANMKYIFKRIEREVLN